MLKITYVHWAQSRRKNYVGFMIKLPFRIIAAPVWLVLAAVNIVLVFLVGLSAGFCYLIAGISVVTEVLSIGFWNQYGLDNEISDYYDSSVCSTPTYRYGDSCSN